MSENETINKTVDVLIVGAGPSGLHAGCVAQDLGLSHLIVDRRGLAHSFVEYPQSLKFFSPPEEMEIGGVPFPMRGGDKPTREDILPYFRAVARYRKLNLAVWERITEIHRNAEGFVVRTVLEPNAHATRTYSARSLILASGVWDEPVRLACPGQDRPHVFSRFDEPTEFFGTDVLVVGGGNSAATAAMMLAEAGARVTLSMRRKPEPYQSHLRPFVLRDLEFAIEEKRITLHAGVRVTRIEADTAWLQTAEYDPSHPLGGKTFGEAFPVPARFVFALLGHYGDIAFFERLGLCVGPDGRPAADPTTYETNVPGLYVTGSLAGQKIDVIVSGRVQTAEVVRRIAERLARRKASSH